jgi:catechol 2,3-dioxygenase-like lactoylglutathione lyase family enzyme
VVRLEAGIVGRDAARLERFYTEVMGFSVVTRMKFEEFGTVLRLRRDDAGLKLYFPAGAALDPPRDDDPWYRAGGFRYAALLLEEPGAVDALATHCVAAGGRVLVAPNEHRPGARMALVADPEGNPWELICG